MYLVRLKMINIFVGIGVYLDNFGGAIDCHYLKLNMVGFLHIIQMKLLKKLELKLIYQKKKWPLWIFDKKKMY